MMFFVCSEHAFSLSVSLTLSVFYISHSLTRHYSLSLSLCDSIVCCSVCYLSSRLRIGWTVVCVLVTNVFRSCSCIDGLLLLETFLIFIVFCVCVCVSYAQNKISKIMARINIVMLEFVYWRAKRDDEEVGKKYHIRPPPIFIFIYITIYFK